jgi:L-serine dehydratase
MTAQIPVPGIEFVPAPMGAGGGLLYSSLCAVREKLGCSDESLLRGLFVAAGVGAICFTRTEPGGTNIGCAGEQGICSAMAAAAITEMAGGTAEQVEWAAVRALQVTIGWPCDPVSGAQGGPCYARALSCVVNAILFSQLALSGNDSIFPFDEIINLADSIGRIGCKERERCQGGWAHNSLPSAQKASREFAEWHREQDKKMEVR